MVWRAVAKPFNRWHNLLGAISGPRTFKDAWARESPVGGALNGGGVVASFVLREFARSSTCGGVTWCRDLWACVVEVSRGGRSSCEKFRNSPVGRPVRVGSRGVGVGDRSAARLSETKTAVATRKISSWCVPRQMAVM